MNRMMYEDPSEVEFDNNDPKDVISKMELIILDNGSEISVTKADDPQKTVRLSKSDTFFDHDVDDLIPGTYELIDNDLIFKSHLTQPRHPQGHPEGKGGRFAAEGEKGAVPHPNGMKDPSRFDDKDKERTKPLPEEENTDDKTAVVGLQHEQKKEMFSLQNEHAAAQQAQAAADEARRLHIHAKGVNKFLDGVRKQDPGGENVHVDVPLGAAGKKRRKKLTTDTVAKSDLFVPILKVDTEQRMVYGFATVSDKAGEPYFDNQGDHVSVDTIRKAWHDYVATPRLGGVNHERTDGGSLVEGLIIDDSVAEALSKALSKGYRGLFVGYHATDDKVWDGVKKGDFTGFSIAGKGKRRKVEE